MMWKDNTLLSILLAKIPSISTVTAVITERLEPEITPASPGAKLTHGSEAGLGWQAELG